MSEYDTSYTDLLLDTKHNDYKGKYILLLGGGMGAALNSLLKEQPCMVTMCEVSGGGMGAALNS
jgi:spermidine synthase